MTKFKTVIGLTQFFPFKEEKTFEGSFTGNYKTITNKEEGTEKQCPEFVTTDGELFLLPDHSAISKFIEHYPVGQLCRISWQGLKQIKGSTKKYNNYLIQIAESNDETTQEETARESAVIKSGK